MAKRSLLKEVGVELKELSKHGPLTRKVVGLAWAARNALANREDEDARKAIVQAYEVMKEDDATNQVDYRNALCALDIAMFMYSFAQADEELRSIGWKLWDNRHIIEGDLYDYFVAAKYYLRYVAFGDEKQVAIEKVVSQSRCPKLKEILADHVAP